RLRDFYAQREKRLVEATPEKTLRSREETAVPVKEKEPLELRKCGNDLFESKDYEGAVEQYTAAIKKEPTSVLHSNRAAAYMMLGWWDQALRDTKVALRKDSENFKALERQGRIQLARDDLDAAAAVVADLELADKLLKSHEQRGPKETFNGADRPAAGELVSPFGLRIRKSLAKALVEASDAVDNPRKTLSWSLRIRPALAYNKREAEHGDEIEELTPFAREAVRLTGEILQDFPEEHFADSPRSIPPATRYSREAARYFDLADRGSKMSGRGITSHGTDDVNAANAKNNYYHDHNDGVHDGAGAGAGAGIHVFSSEKIREVQGTVDEVEEVKSKANELYKEGHLDQAIALYTEAIDRDPDCVDTRTVATLYYNRSAALRKRGEFEKALDDANMCLALHPKWTKALYRRGILLLECGRYAEALTELKVVQRADPTFDDDLEEPGPWEAPSASLFVCIEIGKVFERMARTFGAIVAAAALLGSRSEPVEADCKETEGPGLSFIQAKALARGNTTAKKEALEYHWSSGRGNYPNYGVAKHPGPFDLAGKFAWNWSDPLGRYLTLTYGTAIDHLRNVYLSAADGVRKFDPDGNLLWQYFSLPAEMMDAPSLLDGKLYGSDTHGNIVALDLDDGKVVWKTQIAPNIGQDNGFTMAKDGVVLAACDWREPSPMGEANQKVKALNATTGKQLWTFSPDTAVWNFEPLFVDQDDFVFQDMTGKVYRMDLHTGHVLWKTGGKVGTWTDGSATVGNGMVFAVNNNHLPPNNGVSEYNPGTLSAYNLSTGKLVWKEVTPRPPNNAPAVGKLMNLDGMSVVQPLCQQVMQGAHCDVHVYNADTGALQWVFHGPAQAGILQGGDQEGFEDRRYMGIREMCLPNGWS
ncbi:TTC28, partial [Symbiodinium necroappetens]